MAEGSELDELWRALRLLEQRLAALERQRHAIVDRTSGPPAPPPAPALTVSDPSPPVAAPAPPTSPSLAPVAPPSDAQPLAGQSVIPPARIARPTPAQSPLVPPTPSRSLEATIGQNWAGWVGAIVFVLGVLFFLKYAWDQGWIRPTPAMRVVAAIVVGVAISAGGEWSFRRRLRTIAATLHGTGLAIVLASFFAAYAWFSPAERVLSSTGAFLGVIVTAACGIFVALHINALVIVFIAFLGSYLAPFVLSTGTDRSIELLSYLAVLTMTGWVLCALRPRWPAVRWLVFIGTYITFAAWWFDLGTRYDYNNLATLFVGFMYLGFLAEMILTARRVEREIDEGPPPALPGMAMLSLASTAVAFGLLRVIHNDSADDPLLGCLAVLMAGTQLAFIVFTRSRALGASGLLQAAALVTLAVPLVLDQFSVTLAWLMLAVVVAAMAWQLNLPAARGWAFVLLLLAIGRLWLLDGARRNVSVFTLGTFDVSLWMATALGTAVLAHVIAWLRPGRPGLFPVLERRFAEVLPMTNAPARPATAAPSNVLEYAAPVAPVAELAHDAAGALFAIAGTLLAAGSLLSDYEGSTLTLLLIGWAVPIVALARFGRPIGYPIHAAVYLVIMAIRWMVEDAVGPIAEDWSAGAARPLQPLLNFVALNVVLLCAVTGVLFAQWRRIGWSQTEAAVIGVWTALLLLVLLNVEAIRAVDWLAAHGTQIRDVAIVKHVVMSVLWALTGFIAVVLGFRRDLAPLRYAALALLGVTLLKILIVDMAEVKAVWRILSFVAVGALLLCVSFVYSRHMEAKQAAEQVGNH